MKKLNLLLTFVLGIIMLSSCSADKRPYPRYGYTYCSYCDGTGYNYYYLGGLFSEECYACGGSGYARDMFINGGGGYNGNPSFRGGSRTGYTGECKKCDCKGGGYRTANGKCSICGHFWTDHVWHN